jgi:hypothetical protein
MNIISRNSMLDIAMPLRDSREEIDHIRPSSVVVIRSLSNKTMFDTPDEFYRQMNQSDVISLSSPSVHSSCANSPESGTIPTINHRRNSSQSSMFVCLVADYARSVPDKSTEIHGSISTNESDDDGYGSLSSSNRTLSFSSLSISSELFESTIDHTRDDNTQGYQRTYCFNRSCIFYCHVLH